MSIIFLILPITLILCAGAVAAFAWATQSGQFDDLETPAIRLLHDEHWSSSPRGDIDPLLSRGPVEPARPQR